MTLSDLLLLLKQDLSQSFRVKRVKGSRSESKHPLRRLLPVIIAIVIDVAIVWGLVAFGPLIWPFVFELISTNPGIGATIFNVLILFSFIGSIMISAATVGNSSRMEYLMTMPIPLRTLFLEKTIIVIIYNSLIWLVIGTPIFIGFSILSTAPLAFLSVPTFIILLFVLTTLGVSIGGLLGLLFARILAGRRMLKQIGYAIMSAGGILIMTIFYVSIYAGNGDTGLFDSIFAMTDTIGFGSDLTPGYAVSKLSLGFLVGTSFTLIDIIIPGIFVVLAAVLVYTNAVVSEEAHYSGWLASGSKRSSKKEIVIEHDSWDPQPIPGFKFNSTVSVSIWYNIASIRREARVFTQYLIGPIRMVIWIILPGFMFGDEMFSLTPFLLIAALIPFATAYGLYFAGYETVYEGTNLMTLQLASTNMQDYVKGKAISAVPFTIGASVIVSTIILFLAPEIALFLPAVVISLAFVTLASGSIAANAAAIGGDFKADRMILRQRGAAVQMPIRGWSMLRAQMLPMMLGFMGVLGMVAVGMFLHPIYAYLILPVFVLICLKLYNHYSYSAGIKLAQKESSDYL